MRIYDAHTHLNSEELYPQREEYLSQFIQAGGQGLVNAGASDDYNLKAIEIAKKTGNLGLVTGNTLPVVKATIGYHPDCCSNGEITQQNIQQKISDLKSLYEANKAQVVAIGECGIDTNFPGSENALPLQKQLFTFQCDLAQQLQLPLMIHIRKDFTTALKILQNYRDMTIYIHCRGFGPEEIELLKKESKRLDRKLFIGFCGNVTYKNAQNLRDSLIALPLDQLLLETDAPWLSPQIVRGTINYPANVKYLYTFVAEVLKMDTELLSQQLEANFHSVYKI